MQQIVEREDRRERNKKKYFKAFISAESAGSHTIGHIDMMSIACWIGNRNNSNQWLKDLALILRAEKTCVLATLQVSQFQKRQIE